MLRSFSAGNNKAVRFRVAALAVCSCSVITAAAFAQPAAAPSSLSLTDALARAMAANRTVLAAQAARAIDVAGVASARQRPNPEFSVEEERETPHWSIGGTVPLEIAGKRGRRIDVANATLAVTEADTARVLADVRADVRRAYYQAVAAARRLEVAQELENVASRASAAAQERFQTGAAPRLDALQAQLALSEAQNETAAARGELIAFRAELNALLGFTADAQPQLSDTLEGGAPPPGDAAVSQAIGANADLRVLDRQLDEARAKVLLARAMRRPDPSVSATLTYDAQPEFTTGWRFGGTIALPIFTTGRADVAVAEATVIRAQADRDAKAAQVSGTVTAAVARANAARQAVQRYQSEILPAAQQVEAMAQESYSSGQTALPALLQTLQAGREIRQRAVQAGLDYQLALADLERAIGVPIQ
jgi:cobalt-zinc-cadmium efflux system outer membrane protein